MPEPLPAVPQQQESGWGQYVLPALAGLASLGAGFAGGRNPGVDNPGAAFLQPLQTLSLLDYRQNLGQHYKDLTAYQQSEEARKVQEQRLKVDEQNRKIQQQNDIRQQMGLPPIPMAGYGLMQPPSAALPQSGTATTPSQAPPQGMEQPAQAGGQPAAQANPQGQPASGATPIFGDVGRSTQGYQREFEMGPEGVKMHLKPTQPLDELGKTIQDYQEFLVKGRDIQRNNPAQFNVMDNAFRGRIANMSKVQFDDPRAKLAQDIQLLQVTAGGDPRTASVVNDLRNQYRIQVQHGSAESPVAKLIKDRAYFEPNSPEYTTITNAIAKEINPVQTNDRIAIANQYVRASGDFLTAKDNFLQMAGAYKDSLTNPGSGVNDSTMVFSYMKMVDPTSVVREGEYDRMTNMAGVPNWMRNYFAPDGKFIEGVVLPPEARQKLMAGTDVIYKSRIQGQYQRQSLYRDIATRTKVGADVVAPMTGQPTPWNMARMAIKDMGGNLALANAALVAKGFDPMNVVK